MALVVALMVHFLDLHATLAAFNDIEPIAVVLTVALFLLDRFSMAYKWNFLLRARNCWMSNWAAFRIYLASGFVGYVIPASVGSDVFRAARLSMAGRSGIQRLRDHRPRASAGPPGHSRALDCWFGVGCAAGSHRPAASFGCGGRGVVHRYSADRDLDEHAALPDASPYDGAIRRQQDRENFARHAQRICISGQRLAHPGRVFLVIDCKPAHPDTDVCSSVGLAGCAGGAADAAWPCCRSARLSFSSCRFPRDWASPKAHRWLHFRLRTWPQLKVSRSHWFFGRLTCRCCCPPASPMRRMPGSCAARRNRHAAPLKLGSLFTIRGDPHAPPSCRPHRPIQRRAQLPHRSRFFDHRAYPACECLPLHLWLDVAARQHHRDPRFDLHELLGRIESAIRRHRQIRHDDIVRIGLCTERRDGRRHINIADHFVAASTQRPLNQQDQARVIIQPQDCSIRISECAVGFIFFAGPTNGAAVSAARNHETVILCQVTGAASVDRFLQ